MAPKRDEKPASMKWDGTPERAAEIGDWARDPALLSYAQASKTGDPDEPLQLRVKVQLGNDQGTEWQIVPKGATVLLGGTTDEPEFTIQEARKTRAAAFQE